MGPVQAGLSPSRSADGDLVSFFSIGGKKKMQRLLTILGGCNYHDGHERTMKTGIIGGQCLAGLWVQQMPQPAHASVFCAFFFLCSIFSFLAYDDDDQ
jgi:hypothetical protein